MIGPETFIFVLKDLDLADSSTFRTRSLTACSMLVQVMNLAVTKLDVDEYWSPKIERERE